MQTLFNIILGAALAAVIVKIAGRGTVLRDFLERDSVNEVPVVHPKSSHVDEKFDSQIAPGAPL